LTTGVKQANHAAGYFVRIHPSQGNHMALEWSYSTENLDWEELSRLYEIAPLGHKEPADLKIAFSNSMFKCFVYDSGRLIAAGRALADGKDCSYICDVAVHPEYQGRGLGREVVSKLVDFSKDHKKIILYAARGKEPFYRKLGFMRMTTAMAIFKDQAQALRNGVIVDEA
jgi:ribosomal protein S18 acetylase RimI-like enzyme